MESQPKKDTAEEPETLKIMLESLSPPPGQGSASFKLNWTTVLLFVPYLAYLLVLSPLPYLDLGLLAYSLFLILVSCFLMSTFKEHMGHISNPFDFVRFEFINLLNTVVYFGLAYFFLSKTGDAHFNQQIQAFDGIYFSFVTIATLGYGDIHPLSVAAKATVIFEIVVGLWFFVSVIPVAVADQADRIRHIRINRQRLGQELQKSLERGELKATYVHNDAKV